MSEDKYVSTFAFETAKAIEKIVKEKTNNLVEQNQILEAKILHWYKKTRDEEFKAFFGIEKA